MKTGFKVEIAGPEIPFYEGWRKERKSEIPFPWPEDKISYDFWLSKAKQYGFTIRIQGGDVVLLTPPRSAFGELIPIKEVEPGVWRELTEEELASEEYKALATAKRFYSKPEV